MEFREKVCSFFLIGLTGIIRHLISFKFVLFLGTIFLMFKSYFESSSEYGTNLNCC